MALATPALPVPACSPAGHATVEPEPNVQLAPAVSFNHSVKFCVVPDPSARWTTTMLELGRLASGLRALMAGSFQVLMACEKIFAVVSESSFRSFTPLRLYDKVMPPNRSGKYKTPAGS